MSGVELNGGMIAAIVAGAVSTAGLLSMAAFGDWGRRNSAYFSAFAVGVLMVAVFFHLTPKALGYSPFAWYWILVGLGSMTMLAVALRVFTSRRVDGEDLAFGYASIIALGSHSVLDGIIYETSFHDEAFTGGLATIGLLLHEYPEGVIAYFLLREAGMGLVSAGLWAFVTASLTTVAGAVGAELFLDKLNELPFAALLGLTAGALLYVMIFHLGPHASLTPHRRGYLFASIGVLLGLAAVIFHHASGL